MSPEGIGHGKTKLAVHVALLAGIKARRLPCHVLPDGITVRVNADTAYEPDALVYCGPEAASSGYEITNPVIIVEVLSPSTRRIDTTFKLGGYFRLPSVMHYLIVDPHQPRVVHHSRGDGGIVVMRVVHEGSIALDPPGLELALADIYAGL
jgi:Uma2 family endonuclease